MGLSPLSWCVSAGGKILKRETEHMVTHDWPWLLDITHQHKGQGTDLRGTKVRSQHQIDWTSLAGFHGKSHIMKINYSNTNNMGSYKNKFLLQSEYNVNTQIQVIILNSVWAIPCHLPLTICIINPLPPSFNCPVCSLWFNELKTILI